MQSTKQEVLGPGKLVLGRWGGAGKRRDGGEGRACQSSRRLRCAIYTRFPRCLAGYPLVYIYFSSRFSMYFKISYCNDWPYEACFHPCQWPQKAKLTQCGHNKYVCICPLLYTSSNPKSRQNNVNSIDRTSETERHSTVMHCLKWLQPLMVCELWWMIWIET